MNLTSHEAILYYAGHLKRKRLSHLAPRIKYQLPASTNTLQRKSIMKVEEFEASHLGQLSSYISIADHVLRRAGDNHTIGLLICKTKDNVYAQYSLDAYNIPIGISEYELKNTQIIDLLPRIEAIEENLKSPPSDRNIQL